MGRSVEVRADHMHVKLAATGHAAAPERFAKSGTEHRASSGAATRW